jgi:hypothetical protein
MIALYRRLFSPYLSLPYVSFAVDVLAPRFWPENGDLLYRFADFGLDTDRRELLMSRWSSRVVDGTSNSIDAGTQCRFRDDPPVPAGGRYSLPRYFGAMQA